MPIDRLTLSHLLTGERLTQGQAARKLGVSDSTLVRAVKRFNLQIGQGVKHRWEFKKYDLHLAYLVGLYLTDGWAFKGGIGFCSTEPELINRFTKALKGLRLPISENIKTPSLSHKGQKPMFEVQSYSTLFRNWLVTECNGKSNIPPQLIYGSTIKTQLIFLAGIIDGDGHVTKEGSILIRTTGQWLNQLGDLLQRLHIRHTFRIDRMLPSGKPYCAVAIRRSDYRALGGTCFHPMRAWRIKHAKDLRHH